MSLPPSGAPTLSHYLRPSIPVSVPDSLKWCRCTELLIPRKHVFTSLIVLSNVGSFHCHGNTAFCLGENNHLEFTFVIWNNTKFLEYIFMRIDCLNKTWSLPIHQHNTSIHSFFSPYKLSSFLSKKIVHDLCVY